jgi:hypothetical protein
MRLLRSVHVLMLLFLGFLLACQKANTPTSTTDNTNNGSGSSAGGSENAAGGGKREASRREEPLVIPAGTVITVRLGETLSSKTSQVGQEFSASVAEPVVVNGRTVIRDGAAARGTVVAAKSLGHFKGGALLEVRLNAINIEGREHPIETTAVERIEKGKGKRSTALIGGGAGAGALIGALAGGGKGAAIGALAGGGAGTAGAAFTGNKEIELPAESSLTFKLSQPVEVK